MKKMLIVALLGLIAASGCDKERTCICTIDGVGIPNTWEGLTRHEAKEACDDLDKNVKGADPDNSCSLD